MIIHTMGQNNCGARCILNCHVENGTIEKITTVSGEGSLKNPPLVACARGLNYHKTFLDESKRILHPLIRVGERGEGKFRQASWEEAIDLVANEWIRIRDTYGPESRYVHYGWGVSSALTPIDLAKHLLALDGGYLGYYNSYSTACIAYTTPYVYGTGKVGNSFEDLLNSSLIILWGHNPAETGFDTLMYYLREAKKKGVQIISVDPRFNDTAKILGARWIPIRPTSDGAMMDAMAYVMITEGLYDKHFIDTYCQGFTKDTMPEGCEDQENYFSYVLGDSDGIPKTPVWAAKITGVPAETIEELARLYATASSAALMPGYGPQRNMNGEQTTRCAIALACLTGNVGKSGGWAGSGAWINGPMVPEFTKAENPYPARIPVYLWTKAIEGNIVEGVQGLEQLPEQAGGHGVQSSNCLKSSIKMILSLAGNALINQHGNINRIAEILKDTSKCEFIVVSDLFMTPSAKFADVILPSVSMLEADNITTPWVAGDFFGAVNKVVEPLGESRFEYEWLKEIAKRIGKYEEFTCGHESPGEWLEYLYGQVKEKNPQLPSYQQFKKDGIYRYQNLPCIVAFKEQIEDPENHPFPTPSGKIEIFSKTLADMNKPDIIPGIPKYVPVNEGAEAVTQASCSGGIEEVKCGVADSIKTENKIGSLQLVGYHTKRRCHSIHDSNEKMEALDPQQLWMNPKDAAERDIEDGQSVIISNHRGQIRIPVRITDRVMEGVCALSQGAWYSPDEEGTDLRGSINVLTTDEATPLAHGNPQHTIRVNVCRY